MRLLQFLLLLPRNLLIAPVLFWRKLISPLYGDVCRYYPSCSSYGLKSLQNLGVLKAIPLTTWRVLRCNPWSPGGVDEVKRAPSWIAISQLGFVTSAKSEIKR
ncbi:MAG: membrane protein insertion efficiency factor YidD [Aquiluna sp.]|nr:membrane protein insertion efficiency factor YidD [Aquiluna sp.]